jgi:hypothetical protein
VRGPPGGAGYKWILPPLNGPIHTRYCGLITIQGESTFALKITARVRPGVSNTAPNKLYIKC